MALDGITLHFIKNELKKNLIDARVEKVNQPSRLEIVLNMRTRAGVYKLFFSADAGSARVQITDFTLENPPKPPMFCMLLRKKLMGAILRNIRQSGLDRILFFDFDATNEIGDSIKLTLCIEIMSQNSNIILIGEDGKIIDSVKRIDENKSSIREVLPAVTYVLPPQPNKLDILSCSVDDVFNVIAKDVDLKLSKALLNNVQGFSPLMARELAFLISGNEETVVNECDNNKFINCFSAYQTKVKNGEIKPTVLFDRENKPFELSYINIEQYGSFVKKIEYDYFSQALDKYYFEREKDVRAKNRAKDLYKILSTTTERISRRINLQKSDLIKCGDKDKLKIYAELISANQYKLSSGAEFYDIENYYDDNKIIRIPVNPALNPTKNAQKYYKDYKKAHTAEKLLVDLIEKGEQELIYIESVKDNLLRALSDAEITEIRVELIDGGYLKRKTNGKAKKAKSLPPIQYKTSEGFSVLVGRNNLQNDRLTFKTAKNYDMWFHTQGIPGSHTVMLSEGKEFTDLAISEAAIIAAINSSAKENTKVPVDYTLIKNIKKPSGALPGKVIYYTYNTIYVVADSEKITEKKLG